MEIRFTKMHGLGNDFVLFDGLSSPAPLTPARIRWIADRRLGVGCDQVLLIEPPSDPHADVRYRIFNADGGEAGQCGNGSRCVGRYLREQGSFQKHELVLETQGGLIRLICLDDGLVKVDMGVPRLTAREVPITAEPTADGYELDVDGRKVLIKALSMGNPHAVSLWPDVTEAPVATLGPRIATHPCFPQGANAGFMQIVDSSHIRLRVYERGVGETPACGTGACAAVVAGRLLGRLDPAVEVELPGGRLTIRWEGVGEPVWMTGPATRVFEGRITL